MHAVKPISCSRVSKLSAVLVIGLISLQSRAATEEAPTMKIEILGYVLVIKADSKNISSLELIRAPIAPSRPPKK